MGVLIEREFEVGDSVVVINSGEVHSVTAINLGWVQVGGKRWVKQDEIRPATGEAQPKTTSGSGKRRKTSGEYIEMLQQLGYTFELCELDNNIYVNGELLDEITEAVIRTQMGDLGETYVNVIRDAYITHAADNSFHPVKRYLDGLSYDGQNHIAALTDFFEDEDGMFPIFLLRWLIGAVAKIYEQAQNPMLVLDGEQDAGKSFFARWLCPVRDMFIESAISPDSKDNMLQLIRRWVWEVGELGSTTRRADRESLKNFLTMQEVVIRAPFGKHDIRKPAIASFIGTFNNESGILDDPTGSRRFMVCNITSIDWRYSKEIDIDQVWAQAYHLYATGEPWKLQPEEKAMSRKINERYQIEDPLVDMIITLFDLDEERHDWTIPSNDIRSILNVNGWNLRSPRAEAMKISAALKKLGVNKPEHVIDPKTGKQVRGYEGIRVATTTIGPL